MVIRWHSESSNHRLIPGEEAGGAQLTPPPRLAGCLSPDSLFISDCRTRPRPGLLAASLASSDSAGSPRSHGGKTGALDFYLVTVWFGGDRRVAPQCGCWDEGRGEKNRGKRWDRQRKEEEGLTRWSRRQNIMQLDVCFNQLFSN